MPNFASPVQLVFSVQELLRQILSYSEGRDNVSNACVCKAWSNEALDIIWRAVRVYDLLQLLAPLDPAGTHFSRVIHPSDWVRFDKYARRVRSLSLGFEYVYKKEIFAEIALKRLRLPLLPRLIDLKLFHPLSPHIAPLISHSSIQTLKLGDKAIDTLLNGNLAEDAAVTLSDIPVAMPGLRSLSIRTNRDVTSMEERVASALRDMKSLEEIIIPPCLLTDHVVSSLASLPRLKSLKTTWPGNLAYRPSISPLPRSACFSSLETLHLSHRKAVAWLSQSQFPSSLSDLKIFSTTIEGSPTKEEYHNMVQQIASQCQQLITITLHFLSRLSFQTLHPMLSLTMLENVNLTCLFDPGLEQQHLVTICRSLPSLRVLIVTIGLRTHKFSIDLSALAAIPPIAPHLVTLRFPFSTLSDDIPEEVPSFAKLSVLDLTGSTIKATTNVASFLSRILPEWCTIQCDPNQVGWDRVKELRSMFAAVRKEERRAVMASMKATGKMPDGSPVSEWMSKASG